MRDNLSLTMVTTIRQKAAIAVTICAMLLLAACATEELTNRPAKVYFTQAMDALAANDLITAQDNLQRLISQHPFSPYSEQALLEYARLEFIQGNNTTAIALTDRFLRLFPDSEQTDYAYYLRGMIAFSMDRSILQNYTSINPAARDLSNSSRAYRDFQLVVRNYPQSRFAKDAGAHMRYIRDLLAQKEVLIGEQYLEREAWVAALNRGNYVLENYIDSRDSVARALKIMVTAYRAMNMEQQAQKTLNLLSANFPDYQPQYNQIR